MLRRLVTALAALAVACLSALAIGYWFFSRDLPSPDELRTWRPPQSSKVYCRDGSLCGEFFTKRGTWVDLAVLPAHVKNAFLAAEDAEFYSHKGIDYLAMGRAFVRNLRPGSMKSGASTISQQLCRNLLLNTDRKISRKAKELILTPRMEEALSKDEILALYINIVDFGFGRYGIEEAAQFYFGKPARSLTLGEGALLAGVVQRPRDINPVANVARAKRRQAYVLNQMARHGFATESSVQAELKKPVVLGPRPAPPLGLSYIEEIRRSVTSRFGSDQVLAGGLRIYTAMDSALEASAESALKEGLRAVDERQGYRGPVGHLELSRLEVLRPFLIARLGEVGRRKPDEKLVADLAALANEAQVLEAASREVAVQGADPDETEPSSEQSIARAIPGKTLVDNLEVVGAVTKVDDARGEATVDVIGATATMRFADASWARLRTDAKLGVRPNRMSQVVAAGDLIRVRLLAPPKATQRWGARLTQLPVVQGALVSIDPKTRGVVAMVGGYDFETSSFNRATQAKRQPGSAFKPFVYAAALESRQFTAVSVVNDAPEVVRDEQTGKAWKPHNYEADSFEGGLTVRAALSHSKNTVSVRLAEAIGVPAVIAMAKSVGIESDLPNNLTLALGTGEVSVLEMANAYATFAASGAYAAPVSISKVTDAVGTVLWEADGGVEQRLDPALAFVTTSLMRSVVEEGTAASIQELGRPVAGKTGTAQEFRDAWFAGFTPNYVTAVWVGFDDHAPLGPGEAGGKAALPIWLTYMKAAEAPLPVADFSMPAGVVETRVDPRSGLLSGDTVSGRTEYFLTGTEPSATTTAVDPNDFLLHDGTK